MSATNFKKCGIVCEYNPLHNGHIRQISAAKKQTGCETLVCLMSGDFTQRGDGAVLDKYLRANHAVKAGADIVLELPVVFATGSAEDFAYGAVKILSALGCDCMHFGSECGDIETLNSIADFFLSPPASFNRKLQENLEKYRGINEQGAAIWLPTEVKKKLDMIRVNASRNIPLRSLAAAIIMTYIAENEEKLKEL